jgi:GTP cyclohydrolase II
VTKAGAVRSAIAALRAGRPVRISGAVPVAVAAVETAAQELLDLVDPEHCARLVISGERAAALHLANSNGAGDRRPRQGPRPAADWTASARCRRLL